MNPYNIKENSSRALKGALERKAKKIDFYQNGKPYQSKFTVSIIPGRDFTSFDQLCEYLTEKSQLINGVQYIFTLNGKRVLTLDELEHGQSYVISGTKNFQAYPYGLIKPSVPRISKISNQYKFFREEDLRLLRPLSSKYNNIYTTSSQLSPISSTSRDNRVITVINNQNHNLVSKVFLNLKSPKSFELLLRDLGHAVKVRCPKRMFTASGQRVHSVSQLKNELVDVHLYYIDNECPNESINTFTKSYSHDSIEYEPSHTRPMFSYNSDLDLRPNHIIPDSSLSSNLEHLDKQWRNPNHCVESKEVRSQIPKPIRNKIKNGSSTALNKHKSDGPESFKENRPRLLPVKATEEHCPSLIPRRDDYLEFPITQKKYQQIQNYVERLLSETTTQITREGLIPKLTNPDIELNLYNATTRNIESTNPISYKPKNEPVYNAIYETYNGSPNQRRFFVNLDSGKPKPSQNKSNNTAQSSSRETLVSRRNAIPNSNYSPNANIKIKVDFDTESQQKPFATNGTYSTSPSTRSAFIGKRKISPSFSAKPTSTSHSGNNSNISLRTANIRKDRSLSPSMRTPNESRSRSSQVLLPRTNDNQKGRVTSSLSSNAKTSPKSRSTSNLSTKSAKSPKKPPSPVHCSRHSNRNQNAKSGNKSAKNASAVNNPKRRSIRKPKIEHYLRGEINIPNHYLQLDRIFSYNGNKCKNILFLNTGELIFHSGIFTVLWNLKTNNQRFYMEHNRDITCMKTDKKNELIATSQTMDSAKKLMIRVWSIKTLSTISILCDSLFNTKIIDMEFTAKNSLFVVSNNGQLNISLWDYNIKTIISSTSKQFDKDEEVLGATVHPYEHQLIVTFGRMHLLVWHLKKDKSIECRTALQTHSKISKTIHCGEFLGDSSLLTGDSNGFLTIWAPFESEGILEFSIKEVKGHDSQLTCLKLTNENILISGDKNGVLKTWSVLEGEFRLLNAVKLSAISGSVTAITIPRKVNDNMDIFVGTSSGFILKGSALKAASYEIIFEGHMMAVRTISFDSKEDIFYTVSLDQKICKWSSTALIWKVDSNIQGISSSVHPDGEVLAIGSVDGIVSIINAKNGEITQHLQITESCIGCLAYSPDGCFLVAGCQDGNLHVLPIMIEDNSYTKVSTLKGPLPILTLQWSMDTQFILTSVDDNNYQELILWDLPNARYIRNVTNFSENLKWTNATCSGLEDATGTWDNEKLQHVINICKNYSPSLKFIVTGDENGYVRLFSYPCRDIKASFFEYKQGGGSVTDIKISPSESFVVSCNFDGAILIWKIKPYKSPAIEDTPKT